ncbi:chitinase [Apostasia shenzhenica]|uniref:Chitinase n=1 Tax=Apostasia shenzhenica TaxID=1088818 RepID=A0A2I0APV5_9ASPA|nr:chitinase [Apostasia shenzhenica]
MALILFLLFLLASSSTASPPAAAPVEIIRGGYYPSWTNSSFPPSSIPFSFFTHAFYAFAQLDPSTYELIVSPTDAALIPTLTAASSYHLPPAKVLLSIGGENSNYSAFAAMVSTPSTRSAFIASSIAAARRLDLDGLNLDWEFPNSISQMSDLGYLFVEWRRAAEEDAAAYVQPPLLLTAAVYFASNFFLSGKTPPVSYPIAAMAASLDFVNVMCFDYHGAGWEPSATAAHAALYDERSNLSTSYGLKSWVAAGMPAEKIVMGIPLYGRTWTLKDPAVNGVGAEAVGPGPGGPDGEMAFSEVAQLRRGQNSTTAYDEVAVAVYTYAGKVWVGYDDEKTVAEKVRFGQRLGIGGYFFWALGSDDDNSTVSRSGTFRKLLKPAEISDRFCQAENLKKKIGKSEDSLIFGPKHTNSKTQPQK